LRGQLSRGAGDLSAHMAACSVSYVENEINLYISQYHGLIKGFFLDQMTNDSFSADVSYYSTLYSYIKALPGS
jgi:hypothetical protein